MVNLDTSLRTSQMDGYIIIVTSTAMSYKLTCFHFYRRQIYKLDFPIKATAGRLEVTVVGVGDMPVTG